MSHRFSARRAALLLSFIVIGALVAAPNRPTLAAPQPAAQQPAASPESRAFQDLRWRNVGPTRGGRVTAIAGVRTSPAPTTWARPAAACGRRRPAAPTGRRSRDGQIETGSIGSIDVSESNPNIVWVGTGSAAIRSNVIIGRGVYKSVDAGRTWQFMGLQDAGQIGSVVVHPTNPDVVWLAALGLAVRAERRARHLQDDRRRQDVEEDAVRQRRRPAAASSRSTTRTRTSSTPACIAASARAGTSSAAGRRREGGIYKSVDGGDTWTKLSSGLPSTLIGKIDIDIARSQPSIVYAMVEAPGSEGGLYKSERCRRDVEAREQRGEPAHAAVLLPLRRRQSEGRERGLGELADAVCGHATAATTFTPWRRRTPTTTASGSIPTIPSYAIQANDGGANVTTDGGRTWSSILNQPTAELYMVAVDEQHPYLLYAPQQDNSTVVVPSVPTGVVRLRSSGAGVDAGVGLRDRRHLADAGRPRRLGRVQGRGRALQRRDRPGAGHAGSIRRTATAIIPTTSSSGSRARRSIMRLAARSEGRLSGVARPAPLDRRRRDVAGDQPGPDRAREGVSDRARERRSRATSPAKRCIRADLLDGRIAARARRDLGRRQRRAGPRHARRRQDVEERHAEGSAAGRPRPEHRRLAASGKGAAYIAVYRFLREHDLKPYIYGRRLRRDVDEADRRRPTASRTIIRRVSSARIRSVQGCSTPAPSSASSCRSTTAARGSRCSRTFRRRRSPTSASIAATS